MVDRLVSESGRAVDRRLDVDRVEFRIEPRRSATNGFWESDKMIGVTVTE